MDDDTLRHTTKVMSGQEQYQDLQHVFAAHQYTKAVMVDSADALDGIYKIERWTAAGKPTILVTIGDNDLIEFWASTELWGGGGLPHGSGNVARYLDDLLAARRPT